jgi:hypothetical protein
VGCFFFYREAKKVVVFTKYKKNDWKSAANALNGSQTSLGRLPALTL